MKLWGSTGLAGLMLVPLLALPASAATLDEQITTLLGLGNPFGCTNLISESAVAVVDNASVDQDDAFNIDDDANFLRHQGLIGAQLTGICFGSAVASGSSLGGSLGSPQSTLTVSQVTASRQRARRSAGRGRQSWLADAPPVASASFGEGRFGSFAAFNFENQSKSGTAFEAGYDSDILGGIVGMDALVTPALLLGAGVVVTHSNGDYDEVRPFNSQFFPASQQNPTICGSPPGGGFEEDAFGALAYGGWSIGAVELSGTFNYLPKSYDVRRNVCALEEDSVTAGLIKQVFAGTTRSTFDGTEWGATFNIETSFDIGGGFQLTPRAGLGWARTEIDAHEETGASAITATVSPKVAFGFTQSNDPVQFIAGVTPTGLELAYRSQEQDSLRSELGLSVTRGFSLFGAEAAAGVSGAYVHEFEQDQRTLFARFAQDLRGPNAVVFGFQTDEPDRDFGRLAGRLDVALGETLILSLNAYGSVGNNLYETVGTSLILSARF